MAKIDFISELNALGYEAHEESNGMVVFNYTIPVGKNIGKILNVGFQIGEDFPMNCPHGPHFESGIIEGWFEPKENIHASPLGDGWRHWSRPFPDWNRTQRTVKVYFAHIRNVLNSI